MPASPERIVAYIRVMRLTDRLLDVADELREARKELDAALEDEDDQEAERTNATR